MNPARFMSVAQAFADMSKYEGTRVGCVIIGAGSEVLASGWNGAPRGSTADEVGDRRLGDRETRLYWSCHAEANAIANAARSGARLLGSTLVVTYVPCAACAKLIVQAGIARVVAPVLDDAEFIERWKRDIETTVEMFDECGVQFEVV